MYNRSSFPQKNLTVKRKLDVDLRINKAFFVIIIFAHAEEIENTSNRTTRSLIKCGVKC